MNICFLSKNIDGDGGVNRVSKMLMKSLAETQSIYVLSVYSLPCKDEEHIEAPTEYMFDRVIPSYSKVVLKMAGKLRAFVKKHSIDIVIATEDPFAPVCFLGLIGTKARYICWSHSIPFQERVYRFQKLSRYIGVKTAKWYVSLTPESDVYMKKHYHGRRTAAIGNPIDDRLMSEIHYNSVSKKIIMAGRLAEEKCYPLAVEAVKKVFEKHPDWSLDIYGEGSERELIEKKISEYGLTDKVILMGTVPDLYERYNDYAMLILTSSYEGYPMVVLEAIGRGLPIVSFDVSGANMMIENGRNGFIVSQGSTDDLADRICELIENPLLRISMSKENEERRADFSQSNFIEKWKNLIFG